MFAHKFELWLSIVFIVPLQLFTEISAHKST